MISAKQLIEAATESIPSRAWESTVGIVVAHENNIHTCGTGTLFRVADMSFVVSAEHVMGAAAKLKKAIAITTSMTRGPLEPITGQLVRANGIYDIALVCLSEDQANRLATKRTFLRIHDVDFSDQPPKGLYTLFGFPVVWSSSPPSEQIPIEIKGLQYTTGLYQAATEEFADFRTNVHLLLDAQSQWDDSAAEVAFENLDGIEKEFPGDLNGISGCSVWRIADCSIPMTLWKHHPPKLVAVQTGVFRNAKAIKATRWAAVRSLIYEAFPELQRAIELVRP
jgi:hypothetical protein